MSTVFHMDICCLAAPALTTRALRPRLHIEGFVDQIPVNTCTDVTLGSTDSCQFLSLLDCAIGNDKFCRLFRQEGQQGTARCAARTQYQHALATQRVAQVVHHVAAIYMPNFFEPMSPQVIGPSSYV